MQFHRRLLRRQYAGIKGGRESTSTAGMFAIYYFHISPFYFFFQFPHLFLSGGQISNALKHHPDVWLHLGRIPTSQSCRAGLRAAQELAQRGRDAPARPHPCSGLPALRGHSRCSAPGPGAAVFLGFLTNLERILKVV